MLALVLSLLLAGVIIVWLRFAAALWEISKLPNLARLPGDAPAGGWPRLQIRAAEEA